MLTTQNRVGGDVLSIQHWVFERRQYTPDHLPMVAQFRLNLEAAA